MGDALRLKLEKCGLKHGDTFDDASSVAIGNTYSSTLNETRRGVVLGICRRSFPFQEPMCFALDQLLFIGILGEVECTVST